MADCTFAFIRYPRAANRSVWRVTQTCVVNCLRSLSFAVLSAKNRYSSNLLMESSRAFRSEVV
jgi:hypothetical protein